MSLSPIKQYSWHSAALISCALAHAILTFVLALTRLYTYKTSLLDIGTFDQVFWNILHHRAPITTATVPFTPQHWFGFHFSPILFLIVPFYALWPHIELLQLVQSLCFSMTGIGVFYTLKYAGANPREAWIGTLLYWLNPFVLSAAIWDFHEIAFAAPLIILSLWALFAKRFTTFVPALLLLLLTKEHYGLSVAGFGALWAIRHHDWRRGAAIIGLGITTLIALLFVVMPALHQGTHAMLIAGDTATSRYAWLGMPWATKFSTVFYLLFERGNNNNPGSIYILLLGMSGLMLPVLSMLTLLPAIADLAANLLAADALQRSIVSYHTAAIIPVIIIAAYQGFCRFTIMPMRRKDLYLCAMLSLAIIIPLAGTTDVLMQWDITGIKLHKDDTPINAISTLLPAGGLSVQSNVGAFFSQREAVYPFPHKITESSSVILYLANPFSKPLEDNFGIAFNGSARDQFAYVRQFMHETGWHVEYWQAPWLLMVRGPSIANETKLRQDILAHLDALEKAH